MGEQITNKEVSPILILLLNWFFFSFLGYHMMGQKQKAIGGAIWTFVLWIIGLGGIFNIICAWDGYCCAKKLAAGESIDEYHCEVSFLSKLPFFHA